MLKQSLVENLKKRGFNEEQIEYIDEELYVEFKKNNGYKILCGRKYALYINEYQGKIFYKILIKKKYKDETINAYKQVKFINCPAPTEDCIIIINSMFEDFYFKANDKYNPVFTICVTEWSYADKEKREEVSALKEFNQTTYDLSRDNFDFSIDDLTPIDDNFLD